MVKCNGFPTESGDEGYPGGFAETVLESTQQAVVIVDKNQSLCSLANVLVNSNVRAFADRRASATVIHFSMR